MDMAFNTESKAGINTSHLHSITPSACPEDFRCLLSEISNSFASESVSNNPKNLLHADVVESHLQQPLHDDFVFENMGLLEPTPIGCEDRNAAQSLDIKLLQDILDTALEQEGIFDSDSSSSAKRKPSSFSPWQSSSFSKKRRTGDEAPIFRPYQETKWSKQYQELLKFKEEFGHCSVPHSYKPDMGLARWMKRQRYQYKLRSQGKVSTMTDARVQELESIGFVWDSHAATWDQRFEELKEFRSCHGHCDVSSSFASNPQLATWVKCQRRQYRLFFKDKKLSSITPKRILELEEIGFKWRVRDVL